MIASLRLQKAFPWLVAATLFPALVSVSSADQGKKRNPTSKLYVAEIDGHAEIDTGEKIEDLTEKSVFSAEGTVIETKPDTTNAIVLSNGTGICFSPETRLDIRRFLQEPFSPKRNDLEVEPSISQTQTFLSRGSVGLCNSKLVAGSSMIYNTGLASVNVRARKVVIESHDNETVVSILQGESTVNGETFTGGEVIHEGQQAIIKRTSPNSPPEITIQPIPQEQMKSLDDQVAMACMARRTVYFEVADRNGNSSDENVTAFDSDQDTGQQEIKVVPVTPANPEDIGPIVTPDSM